MSRVAEMGKKYPVAFVFVIWCFLFLAFYWKVLWEGQVFVFVDASRFFYPLWKWGAAVLHQGTIPLWNPDAQFGTPYLADPQMACAYPLVFLFYSWFSPVNAFSYLILFHHLWAVVGFLVLARVEGNSWKSALWGSLAFGFSLHLICSSWTPVAMITISWLPWVWVCAQRLYQKKTNGFLFFSLSWAMQLSGGYSVLAYLTGLALICYFGWKTLKSLKRSGKIYWDWVGWFGLGAIVAAIYNLVWGLPFWEFLTNSNYQNGSHRFQDLGWVNLATFLSPFIAGHPLAGNYHGPHYWVATYFVGLPTLCFLMWGLWNRIFQKNTPWLLLLFVVLSMGSTLKLGEWLKRLLPGYALVIHSGFWISIVVLWVCLLSMEALEIFMRTPGIRKEKFSFGVIVAVIYGVSFALKSPYFLMSFFISAGLLLCTVWAQNQNVKWVLVLAALGFSLGPASYSLNITMDRSYYEKPPLILSKLHDPGRIFFSPILLGDAVRLQGKNMKDAYEGAKQNFYPNWPLAYGKEEVPIYNTLQLNHSFAWTYEVFQQSLAESQMALDFLGIRYLFGSADFKTLQKIGQTDRGVPVFENHSVFPRWFFLSQAIPAGSRVNEDLEKAAQNHMDFRRVGFIENPSKAGHYQKRRIAQIHRTTNSVLIETSGKGQALLVSSETDSPGWKAWVNGNPKPVEEINHAFRGVLLDEDGNETVVFKYEPLSFRLGLFLSLLIWGLWMGLIIKALQKPRPEDLLSISTARAK